MKNRIKTSLVISKILTEDDLISLEGSWKLNLTQVIVKSIGKRPNLMENAILPEVEANETLDQNMEITNILRYFKKILFSLSKNYCVGKIKLLSDIETTEEIDNLALELLYQRTGLEIEMNSSHPALSIKRPIIFNDL
mmetsp:Transcript_21543/g.19107  ORF Transcript_21543/g.19107 Transcript_21543/m.19107 type:complete len:138 (+) Transcript_21543:1444-1857(+)